MQVPFSDQMKQAFERARKRLKSATPEELADYGLNRYRKLNKQAPLIIDLKQQRTSEGQDDMGAK